MLGPVVLLELAEVQDVGDEHTLRHRHGQRFEQRRGVQVVGPRGCAEAFGDVHHEREDGRPENFIGPSVPLHLQGPQAVVAPPLLRAWHAHLLEHRREVDVVDVLHDGRDALVGVSNGEWKRRSVDNVLPGIDRPVAGNEVLERRRAYSRHLGGVHESTRVLPAQKIVLGQRVRAEVVGVDVDVVQAAKVGTNGVGGGQ